MTTKTPENQDAARLPLSRAMRDTRCAGQHFGAWAVESKWFQAALAAIRSGTLKPEPVADYFDDDGEDESPAYELSNGIAIIAIDGQMTKRGSSFGGCSTVAVRKALRDAATDYQVRGILLHICSPGGTVAGTADLADDVASVREGRIGSGKPVIAFIADMGCSAAYWVASQCERIGANKTAIVGSIGTYTVLEDDTKWQEELGIKWRVVSTGPFKGLGADGAVSDQLIADVQREVNELNAPFLAAVAVGRNGKIPDIAAVSDGRAHVAAQALILGLIDEVSTLDATMAAFIQEITSMTSEQVKQFAAEHPDDPAVKEIRDAGYDAGMTAGIEKGKAEAAKPVPATVNQLRALAPDDNGFVLDQLGANATLEQATAAYATALAAKVKASAAEVTAANARATAAETALAAETGSPAPVRVAGAGNAGSASDTDFDKIEDPKERAKAEWAADFSDCKKNFVSEAAYIGFRAADLRGGVTVHKPAAA